MLRSGSTLRVILKRVGANERHYALCVNSHDLGLFLLLRVFGLGFSRLRCLIVDRQLSI